MSTEFSPAKNRKILRKTGGKCYYCGKSLYYDRNLFWCNPFSEKMTVDHMVPKASGGTDNLNNLYPSCPRCNCIKGCLNPQEHKYLLEKLVGI